MRIPDWPIAAETALTLIAIHVAIFKPDLGSRIFQQVERWLIPLAQKRGLAVFATVVIALAGRAVLLPILPIPAPAVHDEFSYLLLADTLASGRLSNPTHPMWEHFETFQVNQQPTYCSKYPPVQGAFLAIGQIAAGHPWFGVWLSAALMCGAICWMLQGWLPPGWALLGGLLAVIRLGLFSYWGNSYWGGAPAAIGGSLVLGALGRMQHKLRIRDAIWMAIGASILANSRPYEGLPICLGAAAVLLYRTSRAGAPAWRSFFLRAALPMAIVLSLTAVFMCVYFQRTTGHRFLNPYVVNSRRYSLVPVPGLILQALRPTPEYRYPLMRAFYSEVEANQLKDAKSVRGFAWLSRYKLKLTWFFFFGPALTIGLLMAHRAIRDRRVRPLLWIAFLCGMMLALEPWFFPHYAAPVTAVLLVLTLQGARHLRVWKPGGRPVGLFLVRAIPLICLLMIAVRLIIRPGPEPPNLFRPPLWCSTDVGNHSREQLIARLDATGGRHLVFVRYKPGHNYHDEWVYNAADIDNAKVVFARELDPASDRALTEYFKDRQVWLVKPDEAIIDASRYTEPGGLSP
jgi:hypothetical protein